MGHRGMTTHRQRVLMTLVGSPVLFLSSQYMFWRTFNPFQYGADDISFDDKMILLLHESNKETQRHSSNNRVDNDMVHHLNMSFNNGNNSFCLRWTSEDAKNRTPQPFDRWWTHHPTWIISRETDDIFCMEQEKNEKTRYTFEAFYQTQFQTGCDRIQWRRMWSSGWGADMMNVQCGLIQSTKNMHIPLVMGLWDPWTHPPRSERGTWHYAANKDDDSIKTCPQADMTCYFLPYHNCGSLDEINKKSDQIEFVKNEELPEEGEIYMEEGRLANAFLTRRAVHDFKQRFKSRYEAETDCSVIHVRRSDVVLHDQFSRKYFPVTDYVHLIPAYKRNDPMHTIFLLTDDANAISEAHEFHPELRWKYINRTRYKGTEGGWEHQTPSNNPAREVITLLATFDLVKECSLLVHGSSKFSEMLWFMMKNSSNGAKQRRVDSHQDVFSTNNTSGELELVKRLNAMRRDPANNNLKNLSIGTSASTEGLIIVNILGLLANDLFEAAFAARIKEQLGWKVVYRTMWNPAFPTTKTDNCFPNIKRDMVDMSEKYGDNDPIWKFLEKYGGGRSNKDLEKLYDAVTFVDMDSNDDKHVTDQLDANEIEIDWIRSLGGKAKTIRHMEYPLQDYHVDILVEELKNPNSPIKVLQLEAFFIHFDWMRDWMGPTHIPHWLRINQDHNCCPTPPPRRNTIVIHIRDFEPGDDDKNKNLQVGVFRAIIDKYYKNDNEVWVVCQPKSVKTDIVKDLVKELGAKVHTGDDNIDAFCILARARVHIPTTSSSFSQLAALLADSYVKDTYGNSTQIEVHYPTHTLDFPMVTLKVPSWKYHLTNEDCTGISEFDVDHSELSVSQA